MDKVTQSSFFKWSCSIAMLAIVTYILTIQFYATAWLLLIIPEFVSVVLFLIYFVASIVFWASQRKIYRHSYLPILINVAAVFIIYSLPSVTSNKIHFLGTYNLCKQIKSNCACNLYTEHYLVVGGGAWGGDLNSVYLTDNIMLTSKLKLTVTEILSLR